ncbi:MAG: DeoR family transcriptional regulator [Minisyncoccota bacterium]
MRHSEPAKGHSTQIQNSTANSRHGASEDFVLEKSIFNNIFEKDIRRVFIYKKAERLAKALHLVAPAFSGSASLKNRIDSIAIGLVDAAVLPPHVAREVLSRELLLLSSVLGVARTGGLLSTMNTELIAREAHSLLQDVAVYEEPRLFLDEAPTLSGIAKSAQKRESLQSPQASAHVRSAPSRAGKTNAASAERRQVKDIKDTPSGPVKDRQEAVLSVIRNKGSVSIKDISTLIRGVSEKTIQRELMALVASGAVVKQGERRWSTYSLV